MDERIFRVLKGAGTAEDEEWLGEWRAASPENEERVRYLANILARYAEVERERQVPEPPSFREIAARAERRSRKPAGPSPFARKLRRAVIAGVGAAAMILLGVGLTNLYWSQPGFGAQEFLTGPGERATVELADGTVVRLGPESRLAFNRRGSQREVALDGRAYFAVAKQAGRRFVVETSSGRVTVLGTRFDVQALDEELQVAVVEGRVSVDVDDREETEVSAGELYRFTGDRGVGVVSTVGSSHDLEWTGTFLAFQSTPLSEAAAEIERKYDVEIRIQDQALAERVVTAWFAERPLANVLDVVCLAVAAQCAVEGDVVLIRPATADQPHPSDVSTTAPNRS